MKSLGKLVLSVVVAQFAGVIGSFFTSNSVSTWYVTINKSPLNPPNWIFGPVWITLYFLIGLSLYLIWQAKGEKRMAFIFFWTQLALNSLWSILFFGLQMPLLAFVEIIILWVAIVFTMYFGYKVSKASAYLLIPYLLWVSFAAFLNLSIVLLN